MEGPSRGLLIQLCGGLWGKVADPIFDARDVYVGEDPAHRHPRAEPALQDLDKYALLGMAGLDGLSVTTSPAHY